MFNIEETLKFLLKGTSENDEQALREKLTEVYNQGRSLRIKFGMDPSAPDIHLGHAVALRKLKQLQDLGHTAVIIIGDFTGAIGDPSGKSKTRNQLSKEQVEENAKTYLDQIFKILDKDKTELHRNSDWFENMTFPQVIELSSKVTVARMLDRDDFNNRYNNHKPIGIHEFFYPLMQAYDSVMVKSDIELGGTDQTFNVMMGRNIQKDYNMTPQVPLFIPLLVGIDGKEKMSKSLGNYIGVDEDAKDMYVKVMQIPDDLIITYFELATDVHPDKIAKIKTLLDNKEVNPRDIKMLLARDIIKLYHTEEELKKAEENFQAIYQKKGNKIEVPTITIDTDLLNGDSYSIIDCIYSTGIYKSKSEIRRLLQQGAVKVNGQKFFELNFEPTDEMEIGIGKGKLFKIQLANVQNIEEQQSAKTRTYRR
ncbi:MAG: tyrosine--tRNA ligase [Bacilli bacterium]|nr:tyrosine--tRNA ligase [Bacilli bacterium]